MLTTTATTHTQEPALHLPLGLLKPSPTNPRQRLNQAKIDELAASIKKLGGVFQPILARPNPEHTDSNGMPPYEIVAGERRWRASKQAGMPSVLTLVRLLSDFDALEIQLIENIDREDLHPLEEADGLHKLLRKPNGMQGYATAEELATRIGKSRRWVFQRLALLNLCPEARAAFMADEITASVAGLIARMPDPATQAEATKRIVQGFAGEAFTYRAAAEYLHKEFMLALAKAPFDIEAVYQVAGPCGQCPKRSGASPDLLEDVKGGDMCQDSACFAAKGLEAREQVLQAGRDAGMQVVQGRAVYAHMGSPTALPSGYFLLKLPCPALTDSKKPLVDIFGTKLQDALMLAFPDEGPIVTIVPEPAVIKMLKAKGLLRQEPPAPAPAPAPYLAPAAHAMPAPSPAPESERTAAATPRTPEQLANAIANRSRELFSQMLWKALVDEVRAAEDLPTMVLRQHVTELLNDSSAEARALVLESMGQERLASRATVSVWVAELPSRELGELLVFALMAEELTNCEDLDALESYGTQAIPLAQHYGLDLEALEDEADEGAATQVHAEEDRRLGKPDATTAFVKAHYGKPIPVKYRNAATGESWSGRLPRHVPPNDLEDIAFQEVCDNSTRAHLRIRMGLGKIEVGTAVHEGLPALWFGKNGQGLGFEYERNNKAEPDETLAVLTFENIQGLEAVEVNVARLRAKIAPETVQTPSAQEEAEDLRTQLDLHKSWADDDRCRSSELELHLRSVLEIAQTWRPDYATQMDSDTLKYAQEALDGTAWP